MTPVAKILIVEHNPDDIELIQYELKSASINFISEIVKDEQAYINAIQNFMPDIILSDYSLPAFDGDAALKIRTEIAADIPFVFVSGSIGEERSIEYIRNGVTDYVLKDKLFTLGVKVKRALKEAEDRIYKRQIERDLKQSENRFRALIEKSNEMVTLSNEQGEILYISPSVKKTFGYSFEDVSQSVSFSFIHPDDLKEFEANKNAILTVPDKSYHCQLRLLHKKGHWIWCESTLTNMLHVQGVNAFVSNFRDISERKSAEKQQDFDRHNLDALINNTNDLMWSVDRNFRLITSNKPFDTMGTVSFGQTIEKGCSVLSVSYAPEILARFKQLYERAFSGEAFTETEYFDSPVQSWTEISYYPIRRGNEVIGTACHSRDITERKKAEQDNNFKARLLNMIGQAVVATDLGGTVSFWNKAAEEMYGWTSDEAIGKNIMVLTPALQSVQQANDIMTQLSLGHQWSGEFMVNHKSGTSFPIYVTDAPIYDIKNKLSGVVGISTDITARKISENNIIKLNEDLKNQAGKLAVSNEELERFAYVTSHDLQEPLRMVTSFLQLLQKKYDAQLDETAQKYINFAVDGAARMKILILDLLEFSRISSVVEEHEIINLNNIVTQIRDDLKVSIDASPAIINVSFLPKVPGNESQLLQLFQNLIGNALKYKGESNPVIDISYTQTQFHWQFCIADNGIGIDEKFYEKIFIIFQRLHNKTEYTGTGIGLAICKKIVEQHGGNIWVESTKGQGSKFYFTILKQQRSEANNHEILCTDIHLKSNL